MFFMIDLALGRLIFASVLDLVLPESLVLKKSLKFRQVLFDIILCMYFRSLLLRKSSTVIRDKALQLPLYDLLPVS
jgi:hypothetical protein